MIPCSASSAQAPTVNRCPGVLDRPIWAAEAAQLALEGPSPATNVSCLESEVRCRIERRSKLTGRWASFHLPRSGQGLDPCMRAMAVVRGLAKPGTTQRVLEVPALPILSAE